MTEPQHTQHVVVIWTHQRFSLQLCMQEPTTHVYLCAHMQTYETGKLHTSAQAYSPAPQAGFLQTAHKDNDMIS